MSKKQELVELSAQHAPADALRERIKELRLVYGLSELAQAPEITLEQFLQTAVTTVPSGWRYPDDACASVILEEQVFSTPNYLETRWQQRGAILVDGNAAGEVVVGYLSPQPEADEGPFFAEERTLLAEIARQIGRFVERVRSQEALRHNESRYRGLFEHTPIAVFEQDFSAVKQRIDQLRAEGVRDFRAFFEVHPDLVTACIQQVRFLAWSKASLAMYGASDEDELQVSLDRLVPLEARRLFVDELVSIAQGRTSFEWEGINCTLDGKPFHIRLHWSTEPGYEESLERVLVTLEDVSEVKRLQQQMLRAERLAAMGQITAILAHEVQNPLQAIYANLELLNSALLEPDEQEECLALCLSEVQRLREMTHSVLNMSRVQEEFAGTVSIREIWQKTYHLLGDQLRSAGIEVVVDLPDDLPAVRGLADQLSQVLINLALNAVDSMPNGGQVCVAGQAKGGWLEVTVANDGPPIPAEHVQRLFDPFFTTKAIGAGLGLFVSHGIVQQHGGDLRVANLPDSRGVCFTITLPATVPLEPPLPALTPQDIQP